MRTQLTKNFGNRGKILTLGIVLLTATIEISIERALEGDNCVIDSSNGETFADTYRIMSLYAANNSNINIVKILEINWVKTSCNNVSSLTMRYKRT